MKLTGYVISGTLVVLLAVACGTRQERAVMTLQDSIVLSIDKPPPLFCPAMFFHQKNGQQFLLVDDKQSKEIRIFNLVKGNELTPVAVRDTGPGAIPYHFGFFVKDLDSIYLPAPGHILFCINRKGEVIKKVDFSSLAASYSALSVATSASRFTSGAIAHGDDLFFMQKDIRKNYGTRRPSDYHFLFKYSTKDDSMKLMPISLPDDFWEDGKREMALLMTYNDDDRYFVFGAMYGDQIYLSDDGKKITKTIRSKSRAIREYYPYSPENEVRSEDYFHALYKYSYNVGLLWDTYHNLYYRFVWPGVGDSEAEEMERINRMFSSFPTFVIEILDRDFNEVGSLTLPENRYNWNNYFLSPEGLYLAVNQPSGTHGHFTWTFHRYKVRIQ